MKMTYHIENLDCANCAAKMENGIRKIAGVTAVSVNFFTQTLVLEAADAMFDDCLAKAIKLCRRIEPDCRLISGAGANAAMYS